MLWAPWSIVLTDVVMHVAALLLCVLRVTAADTGSDATGSCSGGLELGSPPTVHDLRGQHAASLSMVVLPWVQVVGSMTSVMSNSWTFYYRFSEVAYTALLFVGDLWVAILCMEIPLDSVGRRTAKGVVVARTWRRAGLTTLAVLILFFTIELVSLGAMPPTLPHSAEVYMRHHQVGAYSVAPPPIEEPAATHSTGRQLNGADRNTVASPAPPPSVADVVEAEVEMHVPSEQRLEDARELAATDVPLEILGRIAGYVSATCNCIVAGCALASLMTAAKRVLVARDTADAPPAIRQAEFVVRGPAVCGCHTALLPPPLLLETFLGSVCAIAYLAMLQQEFDDTFYATHPEMMRWYMCTLASLLHNLAMGATVVLWRQRHRLRSDHSGRSTRQGQCASVPLQLCVVLPLACWYDALDVGVALLPGAR